MYQLFKTPPLGRNTKNDSPQFDNLKINLNIELVKIMDYYRLSNYQCPNTHILNQLLLNLNVSFDRENSDFVDKVSSETERLARVFNLIHPVVPNPELRNSNFYNDAVNEFIVLVDNPFNISRAYRHWEKVTPVKVHYHPFTDVNMSIPNGNYTNDLSEKGYCVISINLPMLALQYKAWIDKVRSKEEIKSQATLFLMRYPILNMLPRHMELALINRTIASYNEARMTKFTRQHPIAVINFEERIDKVINYRVESLKSNDYKFDEMFNVFRSYWKGSWFDILKPINIPPVRHVKWLLELAAIPYIYFFYKHRKDRNGSYNQNELNMILRDIKNLNNDSQFYKGVVLYLNDYMKELELMSGGR